MAWSDRNKFALAVRLFVVSAVFAPTPLQGALAAQTLLDRVMYAAFAAADAGVLVLSARYLWARRDAIGPATEPEVASRRELMAATVALVGCGLLGVVVALRTTGLMAVVITGVLLAAAAVTFAAARRAKG